MRKRNTARSFFLTLALAGLISDVTLMQASARLASAQTVTGGLNTDRAWHTATLLSNKVLIGLSREG